MYPHLLYGLELWGSATIQNLSPLFVLQKKAVRIVAGVGFREHTGAIFKDLRIQKLSDIYKTQVLLLMFKAKQASLPPNLQHLFTINTNNTRQTNLNFVPKVRSNRLQNTRISFQGPFLWNNLPPDKKATIPLHRFKRVIQGLLAGLVGWVVLPWWMWLVLAPFYTYVSVGGGGGGGSGLIQYMFALPHSVCYQRCYSSFNVWPTNIIL